MDGKIAEIRPLVSESWMRQQDFEQQSTQSRQVNATAKGQGGGLGQLANKKQGLYSVDAKGKPLDEKEVEGLVQDVQDYISEMNVDLSFKVHKETGEIVVQVVDSKTGEVIRQLPPEDVLKLRDKLKELRGLIFEKKV